LGAFKAIGFLTTIRFSSILIQLLLPLYAPANNLSNSGRSKLPDASLVGQFVEGKYGAANNFKLTHYPESNQRSIFCKGLRSRGSLRTVEALIFCESLDVFRQFFDLLGFLDDGEG